MRILGIGHSCDLGAMYLRLAREHEVRVFAADIHEHGTMTGMLSFVADWRDQLDWVRAAKDTGVIVFESADQGAEQDALRADGFSVIGGSAYGDRLEGDRALGQRVLQQAGLPIAATQTFSSFEDGIAFIQGRPRRYVFKFNGSLTSSWRNYVGNSADGSDVIALLRGQRARLKATGLSECEFVLMDHIQGVETGVGAYFNGERFLLPACLDWEHKPFFVGNLGELTCEMGTLVTYQHSERIFSQTLAKLAPQLREGGYVGYINLNMIANEEGLWPLELTCRFGYPGSAILSALQPDGWADLLRGMLDRDRTSFAVTPGYAVGVVLTVPPFPYRYGYEELSKGLPIVFESSLGTAEREHLHYGEVAMLGDQLVTSGVMGYLMVATGVGDRVEDAQARAYGLARKVIVPNLRYRTDIGDEFLRNGRSLLQRLGYMPE